MAGVTTEGFESKTFDEIVTDITERANSPEFFGEEFPSTPDSTFGISTGVISGSILDIWNLAQAVADAQNRDTATGIYLDYLANIIGLTRLQESGSTGQLLFLGTQGTTIPQFFPSADDASRNVLTNFELQLNRSLSYQSIFTVVTVSPTTDYTIIIQGNIFTFTSDGTPTESEILDGLDTVLATSLDVTSQVVGSTLEITNVDRLNTIATTNTSNLLLSLVGSLADSTSALTGALAFPADTITTLVGTNPGLTSVNNPLTFTPGRGAETDAELRIRMALREQSIGTATKPSIEASISKVTGVQSVLVIENQTLDTVDDIPGKSYETFVSGGDESEIADVIWETKPAGIATFGDITRIVIDENGDAQSVKFSRQTELFAWMRVTYSINSEESFPATGEQGMRDAVVAFGNNLDDGEDYEPTKFFAPLYTVPGTFISLIEIDVTPTAPGPPIYGTTRIPVALTETLLFDSSRVVITT